MTPPIHHLKPVWEIHLSLSRFSTRSFPVSSLSQCCQIIGRVIHMFKRSPYETYIESAICNYPFSLCRPSLCPSPTLFHFQNLLLISCHWWGIHQGPPVTSFVPLNSTHYPETRLINSLVPWSLHALMTGFVAFDSGFTSLTTDRKIPSNVRLRLIHSHSMDCTRVPWESLTSMVISLALVNGFINDR